MCVQCPDCLLLQLLHKLRDFSQQMLARTHEMEKEVDGLVHEAKVGRVCLLVACLLNVPATG